MSLNPVFSELTLKSGNTIKSQSIVESRIAEKDSEVVKILAVNSNASLLGSETVAGEVRYSGRVVFSLVYENAEGEITRSEYGVEFSHKAEDEKITASMSAEIEIAAENTELKQINGSFVVSVICSATVILISEENYSYLSGGDGVITKSGESNLCRRLSSQSGGYELFEEIETVHIDKVIMHSQSVVITEAQAGVGCVIIDGVANINVAYLTGGEDKQIQTLSKLSEFRFEVESDDAMPSMPVSARASVKGASITVSVDESKNKSVIAIEVGIDTTVTVYENLTINSVVDVYSTQNEITVSAESVKSLKPVKAQFYSEKYADAAIYSSGEFSEIIGITAESISLQTTAVKENSFTVEGVVSALALVKGADEKIFSVTLELPFIKELSMELVTKNSTVEVSAIAHNISAKQKIGGEVEMETGLKIYATAYDYDFITIITQLEESDELIKNQSAISVYLPEKGDELWDVAKRLKETPEEILKLNSSLEFPLTGEEKIIFYRQEKGDFI